MDNPVLFTPQSADDEMGLADPLRRCSTQWDRIDYPWSKCHAEGPAGTRYNDLDQDHGRGVMGEVKECQVYL